MKEMKKYKKASLSFGHLPEGKAPLSFGHLPEGEREDACLPVRQGIPKLVFDFLFSDLNADRSSDAVRFSPDATTADLSASIRPDNVEIRTIEHRISLPRCLAGNNESGRVHTRNLTDNDIQTDIQKSAPSPPPGVYFHGRGREGLTPHLPRGGFYSGDCPGAAAITITYSLFSSPWESPNREVEFGTPHSQCGVTPKGFLRKNSASRSACKGLPVINLQALHRSSFVLLCPPYKGDEISRWLSGLVAGSEGVQEVSTTTPKIRMKGFLKERRYAVT